MVRRVCSAPAKDAERIGNDEPTAALQAEPRGRVELYLFRFFRAGFSPGPTLRLPAAFLSLCGNLSKTHMKRSTIQLIALLLFSGVFVIPHGWVSSKDDCECSYDLTLQQGYSLIANHCDHKGGNHLSKIFPVVPEGSEVYTWDTEQQTWSPKPARYTNGHWAPNLKLNPGEGALFHNPGAAVTVNVCGSHHQFVPPEIPKPGLYYLLSMQEPAVGSYEDIVGRDPNVGDLVYRWSGTAYTVYTYLGDGLWEPEKPSIAVGESVFIFIATLE